MIILSSGLSLREGDGESLEVFKTMFRSVRRIELEFCAVGGGSWQRKALVDLIDGIMDES